MIRNSFIMTFILAVMLIGFLCGTLFMNQVTGMGPKDILVWNSYGPSENKLFTEIAAEWSKTNPGGYKIHVAQIPWMGQESKYRTALIAGAPPDIGRVDTPFVPELVHNGILEDITQFVTPEILKEYVPAAISSCIIKDKDGKERVYGFPDQTNGACLFYNKQLFREAGLDPENPPKTWDEFLAYCKKLTIPEKDQFGFGMDNSLWWSFPFFNTYGAEFLNPEGDKCLLNSKEAIAALQFKIDLYRVHNVEGRAWSSGGRKPEDGFLNKRYAMVLMGPWKVADFRKAKVDFGVALVPAGPKGTSTNVGGTNMVIFKQRKRSPEHLKACYDFLRYLTSAEVQAKWASELRQIPVNMGAYANVKIDDSEEAKILSVFMEQMKTAKARPKVLKYAQLELIINPEMENALNGGKTVEQALNDAVKRIEAEALPKK